MYVCVLRLLRLMSSLLLLVMAVIGAYVVVVVVVVIFVVIGAFVANVPVVLLLPTITKHKSLYGCSGFITVPVDGRCGGSGFVSINLAFVWSVRRPPVFVLPQFVFVWSVRFTRLICFTGSSIENWNPCMGRRQMNCNA